MYQASEEMKFERMPPVSGFNAKRTAHWRETEDYRPSREDKDIIAMAEEGQDAVVQVFLSGMAS